jgi:hypothetical protein
LIVIFERSRPTISLGMGMRRSLAPRYLSISSDVSPRSAPRLRPRPRPRFREYEDGDEDEDDHEEGARGGDLVRVG